MCHWFSSSSTPFRGVYSLALAFVPIFPVIAGLNVWMRPIWTPRPLTGHASVLSSRLILALYLTFERTQDTCLEASAV